MWKSDKATANSTSQEQQEQKEQKEQKEQEVKTSNYPFLNWLLIAILLTLLVLGAIWISSLYTRGWINESKVSIDEIEEVVNDSEGRVIDRVDDTMRLEKELWDQTQAKLDSLLARTQQKQERQGPENRQLQTVIIREAQPEPAKEKGELLAPDAMHHL